MEVFIKKSIGKKHYAGGKVTGAEKPDEGE